MTSEMIIMGCTFGEDAIQINFVEQKHTSSKGGIEQQLTITREGNEDLLIDIENAFRTMVEEYFIDVRNPPDSIPAGSRLIRNSGKTPDEHPVLDD